MSDTAADNRLTEDVTVPVAEPGRGIPPVGDKARRRLNPDSLGVRIGLYLAIVVLLGVVAALVWHAIVKLPTYLTSDDGSVQMTERAIGQIFAIDAIFVIIGLLVGVVLGLVAWFLFNKMGWPLAVMATLGGLASGGTCWLMGIILGPRNFAERVVSANVGDQVPIDFQLHTVSALLVWALGAIIPVMLYANLSREDDGDESADASDVSEARSDSAGKVTSG